MNQQGHFDYQLYMENVKNIFLSSIPLEPENKWEHLGDYDGIKLHSRTNDNGYRTNRTQVTMDYSLDSILSIIKDVTLRSSYDEKIDYGKVIETVDDIVIYEMRTKSPFFMVSPRDFVIASKVFHQDESTVLVVAKSILYPKYPAQKGIVRADLLMQSWQLKKIDENQTDVILIRNLNPNGTIPPFIINKGAQFQADMMKGLMKLLSQQKK